MPRCFQSLGVFIIILLLLICILTYGLISFINFSTFSFVFEKKADVLTSPFTHTHTPKRASFGTSFKGFVSPFHP